MQIFDGWVKNARTGRPPKSICSSSCLLLLITFPEFLTGLPLLTLFPPGFHHCVPTALCLGSLPATPALVYILSSPFSNSTSGNGLQKFFSNCISLVLSIYSQRIKVQRIQPKKKVSFWFITQTLSSISLNDTSRAGQSLTNFRWS